MRTGNEMSTGDDVYDVVLASSTCSYLKLIFTRLSNFLVVEIDKLYLDASGFTIHEVLRRRDDLGEYATYKNFGWAVTGSTDTFGCQQSSLTMFWGWWDNTCHVYQLCIRAAV